MFNLDLDFLFNFNLDDNKVKPTRGVAVKSPCKVSTCMVILIYLIKNNSPDVARKVNKIK